ncbi:hypothetical protein GW17_00060953 [Ensete ventricosum]|nr:hypothetical protein GW17_00060953 [Ensete ventricosum]
MASSSGSRPSSDGSLSSSSTSSIMRNWPFLQRCSRLHGSSQCQHNPLADRSRSSTLINFFGVGTRIAVEGAIGLGMAGHGVTLVLRASWFNRSSWIPAKKIAAIRVYGCRALTSPRIFGFRPSMKVSGMGILEKGWPVGRWIGLGGSKLRFRADLGGYLVSV